MKTLTVFDVNINLSQKDIFQKETYCVIADLQGNCFLLLTYLVHLGFVNPKGPNAHTTVIQNFKSLLQSRKFTEAEVHKILSQNFIVPDDVKTLPSSPLQCGALSIPFSRDPAFLGNLFSKGPAPEKRRLISVGDVICDRGPSDFITLAILRWLVAHQVDYTVVMGNHDYTPLISRFARQNCDQAYYKDLPKAHQKLSQFHVSFDYFRLTPGQQREFKDMLATYYNRISLFEVLFDANNKAPVLLSHAPITQHSLYNILKIFIAEENALGEGDLCSIFKYLFDFEYRDFWRKFIDHFHRYFRGKLNQLLTQEYDPRLRPNADITSFPSTEEDYARDLVANGNLETFYATIESFTPKFKTFEPYLQNCLFYNAISKFCWNRKLDPFFVDRFQEHNISDDSRAPAEDTDSTVGSVNNAGGSQIQRDHTSRKCMKFGYQVFGHMSGCEDEMAGISETQICLDNGTGKDDIPSKLTYAMFTAVK